VISVSERAELTRAEVIRLIFSQLPDTELAVLANGYISRTAAAVAPRNQNFYMVGSMGLASSIGLGLAMAHPERPVTVIDGDGNFLMGLAALPMVGHIAARHLTHVVIDNGSYASTGFQPTISGSLDYEQIAKSCGYRFAAADITNGQVLVQQLRRVRLSLGPALVHVLVNDLGEAPGPDITEIPAAGADRIRKLMTS
jgi:thiamine pyrophosphate-dependent acetolactate synthase large subunit-like protein